jgi:soluble cytochrome b562
VEEESVKEKSNPIVLCFILAIVGLALACAVPDWVTQAEQITETAVPIASAIIDIADPAVAPVVTIVVQGFNALATTLDTFKASQTATNLQAVQAAVAAVNTNVSQLESAAQIKNAGTASEITQIVSLVSQAVTEITDLVPGSVGAAAGTPPLQPAKHWKAKDFKKAFNAIAKHDPRLKPL